MGAKPVSDCMWEFRDYRGEIVFSGDTRKVREDAKKGPFARRIGGGLEYRVFDSSLRSEDGEKPEWKAIGEDFYAEAGISKREFERREKLVSAVVVAGGLVVLVGAVGVLVWIVSFAFPVFAGATPVQVGGAIGWFVGLLFGVAYLWRKFGWLPAILALFGGMAAIGSGLM